MSWASSSTTQAPLRGTTSIRPSLFRRLKASRSGVRLTPRSFVRGSS